MPLLPLQVGGLALHFPITAGGTTHQHSLQERVRAGLPATRSSQLTSGDLRQLALPLPTPVQPQLKQQCQRPTFHC